MAKKVKKDASADEPKRDTLKWTQEWDNVFIDAMLEQQVNGYRIDGTFTSAAYANMLKRLTNELKYPFDKDHLKNRMKTLKNNFNSCYDLFRGMSGFAWNPETKLFDAEPETLRELIQAKPAAKKWMTTPIQNYGKLLELFGKDRATGSAAESAKEKARRWAQEETSIDLDINEVPNVTAEFGTPFQNDAHDDNHEPNGAENVSFEGNSPCESSFKHRNKKVKTNTIIEKQFEAMNNGIKEVAEVMRVGNAISEKLVAIQERCKQRCYSETEVFEELVNIGVPDYLQLDAFLFLINSPPKMRAFFGVPKELRQELLIKMMSATNV
ncbi:hypothetical protein PTKIN_Ptkin19aG0017000 [Pterospermum kingtungense]